MRRPALILVLVILSVVGLAVVSYLAGKGMSRMAVTKSADELAWLQTEFQLTEAEMDRIRPLHEGYLPQCYEMCARIAEKERELDSILAKAPASNDVIRAKLSQIAALRVQCQAQMLAHFQEVSLQMPAGQGRRYLAEMQRLTLSSHEQLEKSMAPANHSAHGDH